MLGYSWMGQSAADALPESQVQLFVIDGLAHIDFRRKAHNVPQLLGLTVIYYE
jgi:hypothetical protein